MKLRDLFLVSVCNQTSNVYKRVYHRNKEKYYEISYNTINRRKKEDFLILQVSIVNIFAFIMIFLTDQKISNDVSNLFENFANHHAVFTDFNPDHLVLYSEQQQQRKNKPKHGKQVH